MSDQALLTKMADGEWHRLHPATPLLKGGLAFVAILGFFVAQSSERLVEGVFGGESDDPISELVESGYLWPLLLGLIGLLILIVAGFFLSWRMHSFRITDEVVEVRSGILFRTNRKARLDRIQGINIVRPFLARLVGAARLEVAVAGQGANVQLDYLGSGAADGLRADILRLASGSHEATASTPKASSGDPLRDRVAELLAPELDPQLAAPHSVVAMPLVRVIGSLLLSGTTVFIVVGVFALAIAFVVSGELGFLLPVLPGVIAVGSYYVNRFSKSLRFTIAGTADGIRIGYGLLSTTNETLPPGRIHSIQLSQPLLWRLAGWWEIKVNRASKSSAEGAGNQANTTILPVGNRDDVLRVLALVLPSLDTPEHLALLDHGMNGGPGYQNSPRRAALLHLFSWRRNGFAMEEDAVLLRTGAVWRRLVIVPLARIQSVALEVGWLRRRLRLATLRLHTVAGPIVPVITAVDEKAAAEFFNRVAAAAALYGSRDTSQRWHEND